MPVDIGEYRALPPLGPDRKRRGKQHRAGIAAGHDPGGALVHRQRPGMRRGETGLSFG
jgi:hypothetical protein